MLIAVAYIACVGDLCRRMIFDLRYGWTPAWHRFRRDFIALNASWMAVGRWIVHKTTSPYVQIKIGPFLLILMGMCFLEGALVTFFFS